MPQSPYPTQPFRRPSSPTGGECSHDPADMGAEYGMELRLTDLAPPVSDEPTTPGPLSAPTKDR
jgi:hypothetical protein